MEGKRSQSRAKITLTGNIPPMFFVACRVELTPGAPLTHANSEVLTYSAIIQFVGETSANISSPKAFATNSLCIHLIYRTLDSQSFESI